LYGEDPPAVGIASPRQIERANGEHPIATSQAGASTVLAKSAQACNGRPGYSENGLMPAHAVLKATWPGSAIIDFVEEGIFACLRHLNLADKHASAADDDHRLAATPEKTGAQHE
jgi:hypothetical protein